MIGQTIAHYKITGKLGAGGMGEVYLADDTKLGRKVALKFLSESLCGSAEARQRFLREARAAAALNHPNIVTIHDVNEHDGRPYFAMEHVSGQPLGKHRESAGQSIDKILPLIKQIGEGLKVAHQSGITHRDLKPDNILVNAGGMPKILDFGLAQVRGASKLTRDGSTLGTAAYMSPEQINGSDVDQRSDIWSFGVIIYEMLTGQSPYQRDIEQATMYAILSEEPARPSTINNVIPAPMEKIVLKMLAKDREQRYMEMTEILRDLAALSGPQTIGASVEPGIVVLPFEDISPDKDNEYFSDGLTEEIIADLSKIQSLRVISRTSAMRYKGTDKSVQVIGRELSVSHVLEGSVRKAGDKLRITAQLIEAAKDRHVWAEKYTGSLDDIFEIQEKVAQAIAEAMKLTLTAQEKHDLSVRKIDDARAYDCYLQARRDFKWSEAELDRARRKLAMGLELVGDNPVLFAGMGYLHYQYVNAGLRQDEDIAKAQEYVRKALALDPESPEAHLVAGMVGMAFLGEQRESLQHLKRALAATPNDTDTLFWLNVGLGIVGRSEEARPLADRLLRIDPFSPLTHMAAGWVRFMSGQFGDAQAPYMKSHELSPSSMTDFLYTLALLYNGQTGEALARMGHFTDLAFFLDRVMLMYLYSHQNREAEAAGLITPDLEATAKRDPQWSWHLAAGYTVIGDTERAFDWLDNAVNRGFFNYRMLAEYDPYLAPLRNDARFTDIVERARNGCETLSA